MLLFRKITIIKVQKEIDLTAIIDEQKLKADETRKFMENSFRDGFSKPREQTLIEFYRLYRVLAAAEEKKETVIEVKKNSLRSILDWYNIKRYVSK